MAALLSSQESRPKAISLRLVMERSLTMEELVEYNRKTEDEALESAQKLKTLHLEWQNIKEIASLDLFESAEVLYMQHNCIERIEGLECMPRLQFLALQGNRIAAVENLLALNALEFLDLSKNQIEVLDVSQLPPSINMLNLKENACTQVSGYREGVLRRLADLVMLDGEELQDLQASGNMMPDLNSLEEPEQVEFAPSQGLSAFHDRKAMQADAASNMERVIQAYTTEVMADVEGFSRQLEGALERSKARRSALPDPKLMPLEEEPT